MILKGKVTNEMKRGSSQLDGAALTPQPKRKSRRLRHRTLKGLEYDSTFMKDDDELFGDAVAKTKSTRLSATPKVIHVNTPEREQPISQHDDLLVVVNDVVESLFDKVAQCITEEKERDSGKEKTLQALLHERESPLPPSVMMVNSEFVREIHFENVVGDDHVMNVMNVENDTDTADVEHFDFIVESAAEDVNQVGLEAKLNLVDEETITPIIIKQTEFMLALEDDVPQTPSLPRPPGFQNASRDTILEQSRNLLETEANRLATKQKVDLVDEETIVPIVMQQIEFTLELGDDVPPAPMSPPLGVLDVPRDAVLVRIRNSAEIEANRLAAIARREAKERNQLGKQHNQQHAEPQTKHQHQHQQHQYQHQHQHQPQQQQQQLQQQQLQQQQLQQQQQQQQQLEEEQHEQHEQQELSNQNQQEQEQKHCEQQEKNDHQQQPHLQEQKRPHQHQQEQEQEHQHQHQQPQEEPHQKQLEQCRKPEQQKQHDVLVFNSLAAECDDCVHLKETMRTMELAIDELSKKVSCLTRLAEEKEKHHQDQLQKKNDELSSLKIKEQTMETEFRSMENAFAKKYDSLRDEFVTSEENAKLLCMNLTDQRDRNEVLKNEVKVLKLQAETVKDNETVVLRRELREFKNTVERKLYQLEKDQKLQKQQHQDKPTDLSHISSKRQQKTSSTSDKKSLPSPKSTTAAQSLPSRTSRTSESTLESSPTPSPKKSSPKKYPPKKSSPKKLTRFKLPSPKVNTLRYTSNNPQTRELEPDENGRSNTPSSADAVDEVLEDKIRRIAKLRENRERKNRKTMIFGSSHAKSIKRDMFNEELDMGNADIFAYPGYTAEYITKYMIPHIVEECPHTVVLVAGGNDIPRRRATMKELEAIANHLIEGGKLCKETYGVSRVFISSILPRVFGDFQVNKHILNRLLEDLCRENDLIFINHSENIILKHHIGRDGVHLNNAGCHLFSKNILECLN